MSLYTPNNIHFRIVSSKTLAQFKNDQSFDFAELVYNSKVSFGADSREAVLLCYEEFFGFLLMLEKYFISLSHSTVLDGSHTQYIRSLMRQTTDRIRSVVQENPQYFGDVQKVLDTRAVRLLHERLRESAGSVSGKTIYTAYPFIATLLSDVLHQILLALAEHEEMGKQKTIVINCGSYSTSSEDILPSAGELALVKALQYSKWIGSKNVALRNVSLSESDFREVRNKLEGSSFHTSQ
jgi:hypothetical protein